ncbi:MAG: 50S ribosomal protein L23 [Candidatus Thermofonsia Clade 1 bacterium]|uniref:Large ribosomal subunit protein uL23 n=1 Tax=Candidatus Thermofonsia Clade 1 bacterium TaxID=2364210 RepID=A0A2M8PYJ8_9CHLR|nr:MAG: 50S ribosomal protein L23 [Candidatus Thermofonsia Clade 1 bacterium]PJF42625.1 MAG: 50S ribosomal protein L23 [Candidatus Thermofonsia Clade 1 bacterium]RMF51650.1 MAG: 50S ribosomal protein L23 [Chloroflexota bacterium]
MHLYEVIKRPIITEGSTILAREQNQFTFEVDMRANKIQIKEAVEVIFNVDVIKVATMIMPMKRGRRGRKTYARTPAWKKAIVTLPEGQTIGLFNL